MYRIACPSCERVYDAVEAADCNCLVARRTFVCPHCGSCLCSAPKSLLKRFWEGAPPELWARRRGPGFRPPKKEEPAKIDPSKPIVLFADDDPTGCRVAQQVIGALGCNVLIARDGEQLLERAREVRPDLVITDALMPRRDGREVAKVIKQEMPDTRVVLVTSIYKDPRYKYEAFREFAIDEYLTKPVAPDTLRDVVNRLLAVTGGKP